METNYRKVVILRGIPGSGKTTYAKELVSQGFKRVNKDDIRHMINSYSLDNADERLIHIMQDYIIKTLMFFGRNIVIDNTHAKEKYVTELVKTIKEYDKIVNYDYGISIEVIDTPLEDCLVRNSQRENPVFEEVIRKMYRELHS